MQSPQCDECEGDVKLGCAHEEDSATECSKDEGGTEQPRCDTAVCIPDGASVSEPQPLS